MTKADDFRRRVAIGVAALLCGATSAQAEEFNKVYQLGDQECIAYVDSLLGQQPINLCSRPGQKLNVPPEALAYLKTLDAALAEQKSIAIEECLKHPGGLPASMCVARVGAEHPLPPPSPEAAEYFSRFR